MAMARLLLLLVLLTALVASCSAWEQGIRMAPVITSVAERLDVAAAAPVIHALRPLLGSGRQLAALVPCDSWRLGVEAHNVIGWKTVPASCEGYVGHYMLGKHYRRDSKVVVDEAVAYADTLKLTGNGEEIWVFDIDETSLSNLPYYAKHGFGATPFNQTSFSEYVAEASAPALPETLRLYRKVLSLGIKPVFLTGRGEDQRAATVVNLRRQGYNGWEKLLLKPAKPAAVAEAKVKATAVSFKSGQRQKLVDDGFIIVGNIGDQWSDILGAPEGGRTFKLPDPMYYIG